VEDIKGLTLEELRKILVGWDRPQFHAEQILKLETPEETQKA